MAQIIGRITVNEKEILEIDARPMDGAGTPAPRGSLAMYDSGTVGYLFLKAGAADTAWVQVDTPEGADWQLDGNPLSGADAIHPNEFLGSNNDFDVAFRRNNQEMMRLVSEGLLVGLNASIGGRLQLGVSNLGDEILKQSSPNGGAGARVIRVSRQYKLQTTDATLGVLASLEIPASSRIQAKIFAGCNQHGGTGGALGDGADYERTLSAKRLASGNAIVNGWQTDFTSENVGSFDVNRVVNGHKVDLTVKGAADRNLAWSAHVEMMIFQD